MEEIKPGEYVKTKDGYIGIFDRYSKDQIQAYTKAHLIVL